MLSFLKNNSQAGSSTIRFPDIGSVQVFDDFLGKAIKRNNGITIPHIFQKCREVGIVGNFARAAGIYQGDYIGLHNSDEFLYKAIEASSYALLFDYNPTLDAELDEIIEVIIAAQEKDGYLRTTHTIHWLQGQDTVRAPRWTRLDSDLELYCLGHLIEAAVAHYRATGKNSLLKVARKSADLVDNLFGLNKSIRGVDMIPEIELALVKLYEATNEHRYLKLAGYFIAERGDASGHNLQGEMALDHMPLMEQPEAVGHATFAAYLYSGAADLVYHGHDTSYVSALHRLWYDAISKKMSINGGFGAKHDNEGFGAAYDIPNLTAYNEICSAVAWCLFNQRMFKLEQDGKYFDVIERTLYNNLLSGVSLDGSKYFYVCPTESDGIYRFNLGWCPAEYDGPYKEPKATRKEWLPCACCPPTLARFIPQIPSLAYAVEGDNFYVNLYLDSKTDLQVNGIPITITQSTDYPWKEKVILRFHMEQSAIFKLHLRIPGWLGEEPIHNGLYCYCDSLKARPGIEWNGNEEILAFAKGYAVLEKEWKNGDVIELTLPLHIRRVVCHPAVKANAGKLSLQRGPVLYCAEEWDNGSGLLALSIPDMPELEERYESDLLGGVWTIGGNVCKYEGEGGKQAHKLLAIPYYAWSNRGENEMIVWFMNESR